jgi:hypothetical protein
VERVLASSPMRSRLRFVVAISLAFVLGGWLAYTSLGGTMETYAAPKFTDQSDQPSAT